MTSRSSSARQSNQHFLTPAEQRRLLKDYPGGKGVVLVGGYDGDPTEDVTDYSESSSKIVECVKPTKTKSKSQKPTSKSSSSSKTKSSSSSKTKSSHKKKKNQEADHDKKDDDKEARRRKQEKMLSWASKYDAVQSPVPQDMTPVRFTARSQDLYSPHDPHVMAVQEQLKRTHEQRMARVQQRLALQQAQADQAAAESRKRMTAWNHRYETLDYDQLHAKTVAQARRQQAADDQVAHQHAQERDSARRVQRQKSARTLQERQHERAQRLEQARERIRQQQAQEQQEAAARGKVILEWSKQYEVVARKD